MRDKHKERENSRRRRRIGNGDTAKFEVDEREGEVGEVVIPEEEVEVRGVLSRERSKGRGICTGVGISNRELGGSGAMQELKSAIGRLRDLIERQQSPAVCLKEGLEKKATNDREKEGKEKEKERREGEERKEDNR